MWNKFTEKYESYMYHIAYDVLEDNDLAEDAVQIAFRNIYKNFRIVRDIESVETKHFATIVIKRVATDICCQRQGQKVLEEFPEDVGGKMEEVVAESSGEIECIKRIPEKYADVLLLKYLHGCRTREIAELFGYTRGTVRFYLYRGKKLLREEMKRSGMDIRI